MILRYWLNSLTKSFIACLVTITSPPENATVCRGSNVSISCGYDSVTSFPVTWVINGVPFVQEEIINSSLYQLNNPINPRNFSLTVLSINDTTTFQCIPSNTTSTLGVVTVIGTYIATLCVHATTLL